ncbi:energy transducer TonB [Hymenobacter sp. BT683]|uniref:Energy transducer TonB n=1 Tax=Hymenobacter jeongseonensis TaxID=2791027 RepID=A0ABS0IJY8_9BACT|nr:energy transducer TonB [Hymenobacter jeongseonensis]MBF9238698.1 energy transducer TonB [Hymenobacter jeongseonensis]
MTFRIKSPLLVLLSCLGFSCLSFSSHAQKRKMPPKPSAAEVYDSVAQPAVPLGGTEKYARFLGDNQRYPATAMQKGIQGTVKVSFIVEKTGTVNEVKVETPLSPELDAEAIRLIKSGPKWTPAKHRNQVVRQRIYVPVSFVMSPGSEVVMAAGKDRPITTSAADIAASANPDRPAVVAPDRPTQPVGGNQAFFDWIEKNQKYPLLARQRKIQGKVMVEFMVQADGSLTDARVIRKMGSGLDEEALRLIKTAPKWEPAMFQGKPLKQKMVLPVLFQL